MQHITLLINPIKSYFFTILRSFFKELPDNQCICKNNTVLAVHLLSLVVITTVIISTSSIFKKIRENNSSNIFETDVFCQTPKLSPYDIHSLHSCSDNSSSSGLESEVDFDNIPLME